MPLNNALGLSLADRNNPGQVLGKIQAVGFVGALIAMGLVALLIGSFSYQTAFFVSGACLAVAAVAIFTFPRNIAEKPKQEADPNNFKVNADGSFTYTPKDGWKGPDTFQYEVTDGAMTETVEVTIFSGQSTSGNSTDVTTDSKGGFLLGGGGDMDKFTEGLEWMVKKADGGDLVVLQASEGAEGSPAADFKKVSDQLKKAGGKGLDSVESYMVAQRYGTTRRPNCCTKS
jgi:hypothetical protein